jgi:hypothetical protein
MSSGLPSRAEIGFSVNAILGPTPDIDALFPLDAAYPSTGICALVGAGIITSATGPSTAASQDQATASDMSNDGAIAVWMVYGTYGSGFWTGQHALGLQVFGPWSLLNDG